jgi:hypothetical protein
VLVVHFCPLVHVAVPQTHPTSVDADPSTFVHTTAVHKFAVFKQKSSTLHVAVPHVHSAVVFAAPNRFAQSADNE